MSKSKSSRVSNARPHFPYTYIHTVHPAPHLANPGLPRDGLECLVRLRRFPAFLGFTTSKSPSRFIPFIPQALGQSVNALIAWALAAILNLTAPASGHVH